MEDPRLNHGSGREIGCSAVLKGAGGGHGSWTSAAPGAHRCPYVPQAGPVPEEAPSLHSDGRWQALPWLLQEQCPEGQSCAAREAPSPKLPTPTVRMGSGRAWRARRAKDCAGGPQLRIRGAACQPGTEHTQLPSERGAQPGPMSCSIAHPATLV